MVERNITGLRAANRLSCTKTFYFKFYLPVCFVFAVGFQFIIASGISGAPLPQLFICEGLSAGTLITNSCKLLCHDGCRYLHTFNQYYQQAVRYWQLLLFYREENWGSEIVGRCLMPQLVSHAGSVRVWASARGHGLCCKWCCWMGSHATGRLSQRDRQPPREPSG